MGGWSYLVGGTALVGTKHDHVGGSVRELIGAELLVVLEELHVGTTADQGVFTETVSIEMRAQRPKGFTYSAA